MTNSADLRRLLQQARTIAVVGLSDNPSRDSYHVAAYLQQHGYRIIPVNPNVPEVLGEKSYPSLNDVPDEVDIVDIFRRPEAVPEIVDQAIDRGAKVIWMQLGIEDLDAAAKAQAAGLEVIMNRCLMVDHHRLMREQPKKEIAD